MYRAIARSGLLPFCVALLFLPRAAEAQGDHQDGGIHLDVAVSDSAGRLVTGLREQDFRLYEDGEERQIARVAAFDGVGRKPDPPSQMIIVIDSLNNGFVEMGYIRQGLVKYLRENEGRLQQPTRIARLVPAGMLMLSQPSLDGNALAGIVERLGPTVKPKGIDVLPVSLNGLVEIAKKEESEPGRKLLVWLGAGWPTPVRPYAFTEVDVRDQRTYYAVSVQIAKLLRNARMILYGGYSGGDFYMREFLKPVKKASDMDSRALRLNVLAIKSGGKGELPETNRDSTVMEMLNHFSAEANSFYELSFNPSKAEGGKEFHELRVEVTRPGLTARTITGYYGEPEYPAPGKGPMLIGRAPAMVDRNAKHQVTVAELASVVEATKSRPDGEAAKEIEHLQLTERLSSLKLPGLMEKLPGDKARAALMGVGDASVFLAPPNDEIPKLPDPDVAEQRQILSRAVDYLKTTLPKLPNFYAKRVTTSFERVTMDADYANGVLRRVGQFTATVLFRDGDEVVRAVGAQEQGLVTHGTFGPILTTVILDAAHSRTEWSRWELGPNGPMAVFRLQVPQKESHYEVSFPDAMRGGGAAGVMAPTAYHGEIGIDPKSGAILRLVQVADPESGSSMHLADVMVEYGAVEIGGKPYTCPVRSVSISVGDVVSFMNGAEEMREVLRLNDVIFSDYHVFRSEMRIVPN